MYANLASRWLRGNLVPGLWALVMLAVAALGSGSTLNAQEPAPAVQPGSSTADNAAPLPLSTRQEAVSLRYRRFESTLLQLTEYLRKTDPDRAELLVRTLGRSKENRVPDQFEELVKLLESGQFGDAIESQETLATQLQELLSLLQSEDRQSELEKEQQRIQAIIRDVDRLISKQTDARAMTQRGASAEKAADSQQKVADQTQSVVDKILQQDASQQGESQKSAPPQSSESDKPADPAQNAPTQKPSAPSEGNSPSRPEKGTGKPMSGSPKEGGKKPAEGEPPADQQEPSKPDAEPKPASDKPAEGSPMPADGKSGKSPSEQPSAPSPSSPSQQQDQNPSDQSPPPDGGTTPEQQPSPESPSQQSPATPGRKELQQAREQMERAIKELKDQHQASAAKEQDRALNELLKAKEKLEEILRQMREEEQELLLAALEARFRDMLGRQINVYNGTVGLAAVPTEQRTDRQRTRAIELARSQDEVALLAAKALTLLKEEGSSIAFPEAVMQIRDDMLTSARRLERVEIGELTQSIQKDIVESLEEILDSLQKELEKSKDRKQNPGGQQNQQQQSPALVDALSELKMLRSLQFRVNRRTKQLGRLVEGEQALDSDVVKQLRELSVRQAKIQQTAYDLATERNQ